MSDKISIRGDVFKANSSRSSTLDGPWKPSLKEALHGFISKMEKVGASKAHSVFAALQWTGEPGMGPFKDSRGVEYAAPDSLQAELREEIARLGLKGDIRLQT